MKKLITIFSVAMLLASVSYGAYHNVGDSRSLNATETPRNKSTSSYGATGNVNTTFILSADVYTSYEVPNPTGYGDQLAKARIYWPQYSSQYLVKSIESRTGIQEGGGEDYDIQASTSYQGWVSHWYYYVYVSTPLYYIASANAYIHWTD